jgi:ribose/xylose/arabinose/galactoside ABC-type transport system permease subunit
VSLSLTGGQTLVLRRTRLPLPFRHGDLLGRPVPSAWAVLVFAVLGFLLHRSRPAQACSRSAGDETSARCSGCPVDRGR